MWLIALTVASAVMGLTLLTPALPLIRGDLGASSGAVQQLLTVYLVALAVGQLVYGTVSDRIGRRPILLFGALLYGLGGAQNFQLAASGLIVMSLISVSSISYIYRWRAILT